MVTPKRYAHVPESVNMTLFGKSVFADIIKDLKVRSSWIIQVDPKSNDNCPDNIQKRRAFPKGPVVKTVLPLQGAQVRSLVGELRSHILRGTKIKNKIKIKQKKRFLKFQERRHGYIEKEKVI